MIYFKQWWATLCLVVAVISTATAFGQGNGRYPVEPYAPPSSRPPAPPTYPSTAPYSQFAQDPPPQTQPAASPPADYRRLPPSTGQAQMVSSRSSQSQYDQPRYDQFNGPQVNFPDGSPRQGPDDRGANRRVPAGYDDPEARYDYQSPNFNAPPEHRNRVQRQRGPTSPQQPQPDLFTAGRVIAIVGDQYILAGDLMGDVNQIALPYKDKLPPEEFERQKEAVLQALLTKKIETKIMFQKFLENVPAENVPMVEQKLGEQFDKAQLDEMIERANVSSQSELEAKLREIGTSIDKQRRSFMEQVISRELIRQNVNYEPEVTHQEMLDYYNSHLDEYDRPARVRWEELAILFANHPDKRQAYKACAALGNRVLRGAAFSRVAREQSEGFTSHEGGWHDWTIAGSLKSKAIEDAIFSLPEGQLSRIIESDYGFHVIRVLDREQASRAPFFQEQIHIKEILRKQKVKEQVEKFVAEVKGAAQVWTIFDGAPEGQSALRRNATPRG